jgi:dUTP pyrophosphatase
VHVSIKRIDRSLPLPCYQSQGAAGFDFYCRIGTTVPPGEAARIPANVVIALPDGYALLVTLRSSTPFRHRLISPNGIGVIDRDFHGPGDEIQIEVYNPTSTAIAVERGARIAQGLLVPVATAMWDEVEEHDAESRGGFGSTGD